MELRQQFAFDVDELDIRSLDEGAFFVNLVERQFDRTGFCGVEISLVRDAIAVTWRRTVADVTAIEVHHGLNRIGSGRKLREWRRKCDSVVAENERLTRPPILHVLRKKW